MRVMSGALMSVSLFVSQGAAQTVNTGHPSMAPIAQYLMPPDAEISLARTAAPKSISGDAQILILTRGGFETAVKGTNGFVCLVARSWSAAFDDPDFWDPQLRAPICYNAVAAKSQVAATIKRTQVALAGGSKAQILDSLQAAIESGNLPTAEAGSMSYMLSSKTYLSNRDGRWLPHLMLFMPETDPRSWGAGLPDSPIFGFDLPEERLTVFVIPVGKWSDGTPVNAKEY